MIIPGLPAAVRVTEVGPRDGLQNESHPVATQVKVDFVRALVAAGLRDIEVSSFVRPDRVPQLADAADVFAALGPAPESVTYSALVPNERGLDDALAAGVTKIAIFTAASETFNQRNVNTSIAGALRRFVPVLERAKEAGLQIRGYVSVVTHCPYEGPIEPTVVRGVCEDLLALGCDELSIGDTIGGATPADIARLLDELLCTVPEEQLVLHLHDTRGMAIANVMEGLRHGIASYDTSAGGLGGCPYAPGAAGNLATEDLVFLLEGLDIKHGIDLSLLRSASQLVADALDRDLPSKVHGAPPLPGSTA